jgi:hypothetical protein
VLGFSITTSRSPILDQVRVGCRCMLDLCVLDGQDLVDGVDDHAGGDRPGLEDHDLCLIADLAADSQARGEVIDGPILPRRLSTPRTQTWVEATDRGWR